MATALSATKKSPASGVNAKLGNPSEGVKKLVFTVPSPGGRPSFRSFRMRTFDVWVTVHGSKVD